MLELSYSHFLNAKVVNTLKGLVKKVDDVCEGDGEFQQRDGNFLKAK